MSAVSSSSPPPSATPARPIADLREAEPRYRETVDRLLEAHASRELAAAWLFGRGLPFAPDSRSTKRIAWHLQEEVRHYDAVLALWDRVATAGRPQLEARARQRLAADPLPDPTSWLELAMAQFLFDRAGCWQLREYRESSFLPYRAVVGGILREEEGHQELGATLVRELCPAPEAQPLFERWLRIALLSFGRPGGEGNRYAVAAGLKSRDSAEVIRDFLADVKPTAEAAGLTLPSTGALGLDLPPLSATDH